MHRSLCFVGAVAGIGLLTTSASADPVAIDISGAYGVPSGSFDITGLSLTPGGVFDLYVFNVVSGDPFEDPGIIADPPSAWTQTYSSGGPTPSIVGISGPLSEFLIPVTLKMSGDMSDPIMFEAAVFTVGSDTPSITGLLWNGTQLTFAAPTSGWNPTRGDFPDSTVIPLPSSAALAFVGLGACCVRRRRTA